MSETAASSSSAAFSARRPDPSAGPQGLQRLLAYEEIRQLAARYALAVDSRDLDALVALFVADVNVGPYGTGRQALRAQFEPHLRADRVSILQVGTHVINLLGPDDAAGTVYCTAEMGDEGRWDSQKIVYQDRYARRDGQWYFTRRRHLLYYGLALDTHPLSQPPADWPASAIGRGTVPQCWPTWREFWQAE